MHTMSWHQVFPHLSNDPDALEQDRHFRQSHRPPAAPSKKDIEQDALIHALEHETRELRIYVAALIRLLTKNETITPEETSVLIALADKVQHDLPPRDYRNRPKLAELIEPPENRGQH
jgi:hypothetical protein